MVDKLALETGVTKKEAAQFLDAFVDVVSNELSNGGNVRLVGFGTFMVKNTVERNGVDPRTKKPIKIPARKVPKFTAGKDLTFPHPYAKIGLKVRVCSSAGERFLHTEEVVGSNPVTPTKKRDLFAVCLSI